MVQHWNPHRREQARAIGILPRRRSKNDHAGSHRTLPPALEPKNLEDAADLLERASVGIRIEQLPPWVFLLQKRGDDPWVGKRKLHEITPKFRGTIWRATCQPYADWIYGDSLLAVSLGLVDQIVRYLDENSNENRYDEYLACRSSVHLADISIQNACHQTCTRCGTSYVTDQQGNLHEIDPPYNPDRERPQPLPCYAITPEGDVHAQQHLVTWAAWLVEQRRLLTTRINDNLSVVTEFRGICDRNPPLLFETSIHVGERIVPVSRVATKIEAVADHDRVAKELALHYVPPNVTPNRQKRKKSLTHDPPKRRRRKPSGDNHQP
jgi:hypothetical protein